MISRSQIRTRVQKRLAEQRRLVRSLLKQRKQLAGSLFLRYAECGKEGCACQRGEKHGPYSILSLRSSGRTGFVYLNARQADQARPLVQKHHEFKKGLRQLRRLNGDLVRLLRSYRNMISAQSAGALGLVRRKQKRLLPGSNLGA
jgi:hypothetical protein